MVAERIYCYSFHVEAILDDINVSVGKFLLHKQYLDVFFLSLADHIFQLCGRRLAAFLLNGYLRQPVVTCEVCKGRVIDNESLGLVAGNVCPYGGIGLPEPFCKRP